MGLRQLLCHSDNCQLRILTLNPSEYKKMLRLPGEGSRGGWGSNNCRVLTLNPSEYKKVL